MLRIGEFSKLTGLSIRTLRYYNDIGILVPEEVDIFTGYRYYGELYKEIDDVNLKIKKLDSIRSRVHDGKITDEVCEVKYLKN